MNVTFNPVYILKPGDGKALILTLDTMRAKEKEKYENVIHPIHAMILSFFNGGDYHDTVCNAANYLNISSQLVAKFTDLLVDNPAPVFHEFENHRIVFPPLTLIRSSKPNSRQYIPDDFTYENLNIKLGRHDSITDITLMLNNKCGTDCIYCYANKNTPTTGMPLQKAIDLIDEAQRLKLRSVDVIGGDIFVYPDWKPIIKKLYDANFLPFVSTKVPIKLEDILYLKSIGIKDIQISLDTLIPEHLNAIVRSNSNYFDQIKETIKNLNDNGIVIIVHSIICSKNCTVEDMSSVYEFLNTLPNVSKWRIDIAAHSLYKTQEEFYNYRANGAEAQILYNYLRSLEPKNLTIMCGGIDMINWKYDRPDPSFLSHDRIICTANYSGLFILPDGKVTICEQLYWNPNFIVGDVTKLTLSEIWNSEKAKELFALKQCNIRDKSACKTCEKFVYCRQENGGVCWREVIATYGQENWDFPDPRCDKAPTPIYDVFVR